MAILKHTLGIYIIVIVFFNTILPMPVKSFDTPLFVSGDFLWARSMGGMGHDKGISIAADSSGNVYTIGFYDETVDFDPGIVTYDLTSVGLSDIFVSKLDRSGSFVWAKSVGGMGYELGQGIALDLSGNIYITGYFQGAADFDPGPAVYDLISDGNYDIFVSKFDTNGDFIWAKSMGGVDGDFGRGIALDSSGNVYTTGSFQGFADFDPGVNTSNLTSAGLDDIFVSKLDTNGNFVWAKSMGGISYDNCSGITVDSAGNVYTTGFYYDTANFNPGVVAYNQTSKGWTDIFVSKLDSNGNYVWAKSMGGVGNDVGNDIAVDSSGNVYTIGDFGGLVYTPEGFGGSADFDPSVSTYNLNSVRETDIFVSKLDSSGNFVWAKSMGGTGHDYIYGIALDSVDNIYTTGNFQGAVYFDSGVGVHACVGDNNYTFVSRFDSGGNFVWVKCGSGNGESIAVDLSDNLYTTGYFQGVVDLDPSAGMSNLTSMGADDIFIFKFANTLFSTTLVNSVLPTSRNVPVGTTATIFNTIINAGVNTAAGITLSIDPAPSGSFAYQQTDCATNAIVGLPNPSLDLAPSSVLCYILSFTPSTTFVATNVHIRAQASNAPSTNLLTGINTWLLRATDTLGPDIIALTTTTDFHQMTCSGSSAFAVALSNVGAAASGDITVTANTGSASLPISVTIQETNPGTGAIIGDHILNNLGAGENRTVAVFVTFNGCIGFDPAVNRIFIEFRDASNNVVGSTSTAVSTNR